MIVKRTLCARGVSILVAALFAANAHAQGGRCIDEDNLELRSTGSNSNGAPIDAGAARANLQRMVKTALARSQAIGAARLLAEAAAIDVSEAKSGRVPQVAINGFLGTSRTTVGGVEESAGRTGRVGMSFSMPVYDGGRTSDLTDWRKNLADAARLGQINTSEQVALQTVSLAIERSRYRLQAQVYQQYSRKMSCLAEALETIVRADRGRASELVQAQKTLQQVEVSLAQTQSTVRQIETRLKRFVGDELPTSDGLSSVLLATPPLPELLAQAEQSTEIAQLQSQVLAAEAYSRSITAQRLPQVSVVGGSSTTRGAGANTNWSAGVNVSMPIINMPTVYAADSSEKRAESLKLQRLDAIEARKFRMADAHEQAISSFDRARRVAGVLRDSERVRNFTLQQWQQLGRRSLFDVMGAEGDHYNLRVAYVNALYDGQQSNALLWSLGLGTIARLE